MTWLALAGLVVAVLVPFTAFLTSATDPVGQAANLAQIVSLPLAVPAVAAMAWARRRPAVVPVPVPNRLDAAVDQLAESMRARWVAEAATRGITLPVPVPVGWERDDDGAADARLPGVAPRGIPGTRGPMRRPMRGSVTRLHDDLYVGSEHGRLVLLGRGGAGKTGAMVLLLLAALAHRERMEDERRHRVPVPVWLPLGLWDVGRSGFMAWAAATVERDHPYLAAEEFGPDTTLSLLRSGRVALFLDGFDELAADRRALALEQIEREAASVRLVVTSRTGEYLDARAERGLSNAVEVRLNAVGAEAAADYLLADQPAPRREAWREFVDVLSAQPRSAPACVLRDPLRLSLARDAYRSADPARLWAFTDADALDAHLLERFLASAYSGRDGVVPVRVLTWIALRLGPDQRDLAWWRIPSWVGAFRLAAVAGVAAALVTWASYSVLGLRVQGLDTPLEFLVPALSGVAAWAIAWRGLRRASRADPAATLPRGVDLHRPRGRVVVRALARALVLAALIPVVVAVLGGALIAVLQVAGKVSTDGMDGLAFVGLLLQSIVTSPVGLTVLGTMAAVAWPCFLIRDLVTAPSPGGRAATPASRFRTDRARVVIVGVALFFAVSAASVVVSWSFGTVVSVAEVLSGLRFGAAFASAATFGSLGSSPSLALALCRFTTSRVPRRGGVVAVLEDAAERGVLRRAGTVYQFRHAALQDRLAHRATGVE